MLINGISFDMVGLSPRKGGYIYFRKYSSIWLFKGGDEYSHDFPSEAQTSCNLCHLQLPHFTRKIEIWKNHYPFHVLMNRLMNIHYILLMFFFGEIWFRWLPWLCVQDGYSNFPKRNFVIGQKKEGKIAEREPPKKTRSSVAVWFYT